MKRTFINKKTKKMKKIVLTAIVFASVFTIKRQRKIPPFKVEYESGLFKILSS